MKKKILSTLLALMMLLMAAIPAFAEENALNYLVLGDSIGYGAGVLNSDEACFGRIVADTAGFNFKNDAVNGYRTADLIAYLNNDRIKADVAEADIISISIGGNDFLRGDMANLIAEAQNGDYSRFDEIAADFYVNFCTIIETIKTINPDAVILAQTLYNPGVDFIKEVYQQGADRLNAGYRKYLADNKNAYQLLEVADAFADNREYIAVDNIHPSAEGNVVIARVVLEKLNSLGLTDKTEPVVNNKGIEQTDLFSYKFLKYIIRKLYTRIVDFFTRIIF